MTNRRRRFAGSAVSAVALLAPLAASAQDDALRADLAAYADRRLQPYEYGGGLIREEVSAEGETLRWRLSFPDGDFEARISTALTTPAYICFDPAIVDFLDRGARVEMIYEVRGVDRVETVVLVDGMCPRNPEAPMGT